MSIPQSRHIAVASSGGRVKVLYRLRWMEMTVSLLVLIAAVSLAISLSSRHEPGIKGVVRCAAPVTSCRLTPVTAVVYVVLDRAVFDPFAPPAEPYKQLITDKSGHFQVVLPPGTYWIAAEKRDNSVFASDEFAKVAVRSSTMTDITLELDLHSPQ